MGKAVIHLQYTPQTQLFRYWHPSKVVHGQSFLLKIIVENRDEDIPASALALEVQWKSAEISTRIQRPIPPLKRGEKHEETFPINADHPGSVFIIPTGLIQSDGKLIESYFELEQEGRRVGQGTGLSLYVYEQTALETNVLTWAIVIVAAITLLITILLLIRR
jgi:hypothetical protein